MPSKKPKIKKKNQFLSWWGQCLALLNILIKCRGPESSASVLSLITVNHWVTNSTLMDWFLHCSDVTTENQCLSMVMFCYILALRHSFDVNIWVSNIDVPDNHTVLNGWDVLVNRFNNIFSKVCCHFLFWCCEIQFYFFLVWFKVVFNI